MTADSLISSTSPAVWNGGMTQGLMMFEVNVLYKIWPANSRMGGRFEYLSTIIRPGWEVHEMTFFSHKPLEEMRYYMEATST